MSDDKAKYIKNTLSDFEDEFQVGWIGPEGQPGSYSYLVPRKKAECQAPNAPASSEVTIDFEAEPGGWHPPEEIVVLRKILAELREIKERLPSL